MSENTVDLSTKFSPEEWTLIKSAPFFAGLSVALSDLRSGLFGAIKESLAPSQAIIEAGSGSSNPLVASVVASIKEMAAKRERLQTPIEARGSEGGSRGTTRENSRRSGGQGACEPSRGI